MFADIAQPCVELRGRVGGVSGSRRSKPRRPVPWEMGSRDQSAKSVGVHGRKPNSRMSGAGAPIQASERGEPSLPRAFLAGTFFAGAFWPAPFLAGAFVATAFWPALG